LVSQTIPKISGADLDVLHTGILGLIMRDLVAEARINARQLF
jgi:hypothetical protein